MFDPTPSRKGMTANPEEEAIDYQRLRLDGVYRQNDKGDLMLRIKVPAGVLSVPQALQVSGIAERFAGGMLHLTTRGSIELHNLKYPDLAPISRSLAAVGLTSRGACGGAVRGVACSTTFSPGFALAQALARRLHRHFAGNPHFEGLPKKFKIGVDSGYSGARHLIQDAGLVHVASEASEHFFDVWLAGGLGREPMAGFLYAKRLPESHLIPLIEATLRVFRKHVPAGKRLKHLARTLGEERFRELLAAERVLGPSALDQFPLESGLTPAPVAGLVEVPIFAGELQTGALRRLAAISDEHGGGFLALTADQNVAFVPGSAEAREQISSALARAGLSARSPEEKVPFRICPGSHACRLGLAPTREVARQVIAAMGEKGLGRDWAISGCPNSCAQPQLASFGILVTRLLPDADGRRQPRFALYRRQGEGLGEAVAQDLTLEELLKKVEEIA